MKRRSVVRAGLALATWPLVGCAPAEILPVAPAPKAPPTPHPAPPPAVSAAPVTPDPASLGAKPAPLPAPTPLDRVVAKVGQNHGHVFVVPLADVLSGVAKTYDLTGSASHDHAVTITPDQFKRISAGEVVRTPSTAHGHLHRLSIKLAPAVDPPELANVCEIEIGGKDDHELSITASDMAKKIDRAYEIGGIAPHTHPFKLTAEDFERLARGADLALRTGPASPGEDHSHVVFLRYRAKPG